ncbi:PREDICTED: uncharacterized protein LOC109224117 [Nicotiana attenuata]|uniref:uncharacterized protein LOC109224117 n=1 Tax=Nicotiana attenuata TaxID=49451 RepID=UPI0009055624|nr:PREDICTED: uncharacterized protein LOC109224117 [Nicotiana attenuata]
MDDKIKIPRSFNVPYITEKESLDLLFKIIYPDLHTSFHDSVFFNFSCYFDDQNDFVDELNDRLIAQFPKDARTFIATDETVEPTDQSQFEDFLHSLNPAGLPPYKLTLKENCPVMLLRNLNPCEGLCNGTRLICCDFKSHVINAKIASGDFKNTHVFIPRIPLLSSDDEKLPIPFKEHNFHYACVSL